MGEPLSATTLYSTLHDTPAHSFKLETLFLTASFQASPRFLKPSRMGRPEHRRQGIATLYRPPSKNGDKILW